MPFWQLSARGCVCRAEKALLDVSKLEFEVERCIGALSNQLRAGDWATLVLEALNLQTLAAAAAELQMRLG